MIKKSDLNLNSIVKTIDENITHGIENGVLHLTTKNVKHDGKMSVFNEKEVLNFSSYSYLGLDQKAEFKQACIDAVEKYGTQFGFSRAFISIDLYDELETLLSLVYDAEIVVAPSTTLAHQAVLPVMIGDKDAILIDQQAHASMHYSIKSLRDRGVKVELVRHNRVDQIEEKFLELRKKHDNVWYMCDSVYSMYGDYAPMAELEALMNQYQQFYIYVDDAHGMSWAGINGRGYALSQIKLHDQMILVSSLNKAYAGAGGVIVVKHPEWKRKIRTCGGTLIFSTPIQPPMLGVDVASAKFHLTDDLYKLQNRLAQRIGFCSDRLEALGLPEISNNLSPIFYLPTSFPKVSYNLSKRMMNEGYYLTPTLFPAVSMRKAGLRFCVGVNNTEQEIDQMLQAMQYHYPQAINEEGINQSTIFKSFKLELPEITPVVPMPFAEEGLKLEKYTSISAIDQNEWNKLLGDNGTFDWNGMAFLERTFTANDAKENNWEFFYYLVRNTEGECILATFFTKAWCKDDMFKPTEVSKEIEITRQSDPYYLCTESLMMGSLMTEGNHLYVDRKSPYWQEALMLMMNDVNTLQLETGVNAVHLRDFDASDADLADLFIANGFVKAELPDFSNELVINKWEGTDHFLKSIPTKKRQQLRKSVLPFEEKYTVKIEQNVTEDTLRYYYELYLSVKKKSLLLNTFDLPFKVFQNMNEDENWEMIVLSLKPEEYQPRAEVKAVSVVFCYKTANNYIPLFVGLDYTYLYSHKNYKQSVYQVVKRASELNVDKVYFGITASTEKRRLGAVSTKKNAYVQLQDTYNMDVLQLARVNEASY